MRSNKPGSYQKPFLWLFVEDDGSERDTHLNPNVSIGYATRPGTPAKDRNAFGTNPANGTQDMLFKPPLCGGNVMNARLYVSNLAAVTTESDLFAVFSAHGNVAEVNLPVEREGRRPRGFAIITMATPHGAQAAISALDGKVLHARVLSVAEHLPIQ